MQEIRICNEYARKLMELQKQIFVRNEDLNVFREETIPAIQYCSVHTIQSINKFYKAWMPFLDKTATYLNVGSGGNFLELEAHQQGIFVQSADIEETKLIFDPLRELMGKPLDFTAGLYGEELVIKDCNEHYDYIMFIRYVPFEYHLNIETLQKFLKSCNKYADKAIIQTVKNSYHEINNYFNQRDDIIIRREEIQNTLNYEIDLTKL